MQHLHTHLHNIWVINALYLMHIARLVPGLLRLLPPPLLLPLLQQVQLLWSDLQVCIPADRGRHCRTGIIFLQGTAQHSTARPD
jgi:hypothetical protein